MIDAKRLLDALVGGSGQGGPPRPPSPEDVSRLIGQALSNAGQTGFATTARQMFGQAAEGLTDAARQINQGTGQVGAGVDQAVAKAAGVSSTDELAQKAKDFVGQNPGAVQAAAAGLAGLLFASRPGRGGAGHLAGPGGPPPLRGGPPTRGPQPPPPPPAPPP